VPFDGRQTRRDFHKDDHDTEDECIDFLTVNEWLKEGCDTTENVVMQTGPEIRFATLVDGTIPPPESDSVEIGTTPSTRKTISDTGSDTAQATTSSDEEAEPARRPKADLVVGKQDPRSQYFTRRYLRISASSAPHISQPSSSTDDSLVAHPDLDPQAFELFQIWLHTGEIPLRCLAACCSSPATDEKYVWQRCWPLINAHILGCTLDEPDFADQVMDLLGEKIAPGVCADNDTIKHLFSRPGEGIPRRLKVFVVHRCIEAGIAGGFNDLDLAQLPPSFVYYALQTAVVRLSQEASDQSGCDYHTHETRESCYKMHINPSALRKKRRMEFDREMTSRDSEEVVMNAKRNGVIIVDWEQRKVDANRTMRQQTGRASVGFRRMDELPPLPKDTPGASEGVSIFQAERSSSTAQNEPRNPAVDMFGTAQTSGAVDEIISPPPSRQPPPPPAWTETPASTAHPLQDTEALPDYKARRAENGGGVEMSPATTNISASAPTPSMPSAHSETDFDLDSLYLAVDYESQSTLPGAFPLSRAGSVRTTTPV
jgi:hypothetical protein